MDDWEIDPQMLAEFEAKHGKVTRRRTKGPKPIRKAISAEEVFAQAWEREHHPMRMVAQFQFDQARKWRFDFAWPAAKLAVELDGAQHGLIHEMRRGHERQNAAVLAGWRVFRFLSCDKRQVAEWVELIKRALDQSQAGLDR